MPAAEETSPTRAAVRQLAAMLPQGTRGQMYRLAGLTLVGGLAEMLTIGALVPLLALLTGQREWQYALPLPSPDTLEQAAALFLAALIVAGAMRLLLDWQMQRFAAEAGHRVSSEVLRRVLLQPYSWQVEAHSSTMLAALQKVDDLVWSVLMPIVRGMSALLTAVLILGLLIWMDPLAAVAAAILFVGLYALVSVVLLGPLSSDSQVLARSYDSRIRIVQDSLGAIRDILIDGSQAVHRSAFELADRKFVKARARLGFLGSAPRTLIEIVGLAIILGLAVILSARSGGFLAAVPLLGAMALGAQRLLPLVQQVYQSWSATAGNGRTIADLHELLSLPASDAPDGAPPLNFAHELRLEHVGFRYPGRAAAALADVSLVICKGSRVALTGRTGSGKSTLADLVMGLLQPSFGRLLVDGVELGPGQLAAWRANIAHVPQSSFLTDSSVAENIAFGVAAADINQERLAEAVRIAQLAELIAELPDGLKTPVGERGVRLSGGQRQRLALARAVYRGKPFLVLDEATSALDAATERAILHALDELQRRGTTILIIAHRTSTLAGCDQVVKLEAGRIVGTSELV